MRGLEKDRELRFPSALAFRDALEVMLNATAGPATPLPPSVRAPMPTARDISGADIAIAVTALAGGTGKVPAQTPRGGRPPRDRIRSSPESDRAERGRSRPRGLRRRGGGDGAPAPRADPGPGDRAGDHHAGGPARAGRGCARPSFPAPARARGERVSARGERAGAAAGSADARAQQAPAAGGARRRSAACATGAGRRGRADRDGGDDGPAARCRQAPPPRGTREVLAEADKLLGQGEVADACARGEEAKRMNGTLPATYKFLGKCYMRAGGATKPT